MASRTVGKRPEYLKQFCRLTILSLQVLVRKDEGELMGKMVEVVITETGKHFLKGKVLKENPVHTPSIAPPLAKGVVSGVKQVCCECGGSLIC